MTLRIGLLLYAICSVPYIYGAATTPTDRAYTGLLFNVPDHAQYWAWVTASRDGLFISNTLTPDPNPPLFANALMWLLAQLQQTFGLSFPVLFQIWRLTATLLFVFALRRVLHALVDDVNVRVTAFWAAVLGAGLGWVLVIAKYARGAGDVSFPLTLYVLEPNSFGSLLAYPYLPLAQGLMLLSIGSAFIAHRTGRPASYAVAGASACCLALCHAYDLVAVYVVLAAYALFLTYQTGRIPRRFTGALLLVIVCSAPIAGYYAALTARDPLWHAVFKQYDNLGVRTPSFPHVVVMMGGLLVLGLLGLRLDAGRDEGLRFAKVWTVAQLPLIYVPAPFQIKMLATWQVPLAILAAYAWHDAVVPRLAARMKPAARRMLARPAIVTLLLVALLIPTNIYLFAWRLLDLARHQHPYYLHRDELAALQWLHEHGSEEDLVLAPIEIGQFIPGYAGTRWYLAHAVMTNRFYERRAEVERFFDQSTDGDWRRDFLRRSGATFVLHIGSVASTDPRSDEWRSTFLAPILVLPHAQLYRVRAS